MSEMVERIARALMVADIDCSPEHAAGYLAGTIEHEGDCARAVHQGPWTCRACQQEEYFGKARAVLAAMREPTEAMISSGELHADYEAGEIDNSWSGSVDVEPIWRAMIDAALVESK